MDYRKVFICSLLLIFACASMVAAQTRRNSQRPAASKTGPAARPAATPVPQPAVAAARPAATPVPPGTLAVVNGQQITLYDIDAGVRQVVEGLDKDIADARRDALDAEISSTLLEMEARKRKVTADQLLETEVNSHVPTPTQAEIIAFYNTNKAQMNGAELGQVQDRIADYLRNQSAQKLAEELVARLRAANPVTMGPDVNTPRLAPATVLATVGTRKITAGELEERFKPYIYEMRRKVYEGEMQAIDFKINTTLLIAEAQRRNVTPEEVIRVEVTDKIHHPTDEEVAKFYEENKARVPNMTLDQVRADIKTLLEQRDQSKLEYELAQRLRTGATLQIFLAEPEQPVQAISTAGRPSRGLASAPVTVVIFTDFQCPVCAAAHPAFDEVLQTYGNRVRLVVRDYPLQKHENARKAAEAAAAANAQGKFFEYIALLFQNQSKLDDASLKQYATQIGLDRAKFDAALSNGTYAAEVDRDVEDAQLYGVNSTPTVFVNGVRLLDVSVNGLRIAIDRALAKAGQAPARTTR